MMRALRAGLLTLVISGAFACIVSPAEAQQCPPGDEFVRRTETSIICRHREPAACPAGQTLEAGVCVAALPSAELKAAIGDRITQVEQEIAQHERTIAVSRRALSTLITAQPFEQQFDDWAKESLTAESEALTAALELALGPMGTHIQQAQVNGVAGLISYDAIKPSLDSARAALLRHRGSAAQFRQLSQQIARLEANLAAADAAARSAKSYLELAQPLKDLAEGTLAAVKMIELVGKPAEQRDLMAAMAELNKASWELLGGSVADKAIEELAKRGAAQAANSMRLTKFVADYGLATTRFGLAWYHIDQLTQAVDDRNRLMDEFSRRLKESEDLRQARVREAQRLRDAANAPAPEQQQILAESRARSLKAAYTAGEWFSESTGFRAPGEPVR